MFRVTNDAAFTNLNSAIATRPASNRLYTPATVIDLDDFAYIYVVTRLDMERDDSLTVNNLSLIDWLL